MVVEVTEIEIEERKRKNRGINYGGRPEYQVEVPA